MTGRLVDLALGRNRKQRVTVELDQDFEAAFDELSGQELEIEIKKQRKRRSLDANAYFWSLAGKLAGKLRISPTEVYRNYIPDIGGNCEAVTVSEQGAGKLMEMWSAHGKGWLTEMLPGSAPGYVTMLLYYGSSTYDTAQMSRLIDMIVMDCKTNGIETLTPDKLDAMKEKWSYAQGDKGNCNPGTG